MPTSLKYPRFYGNPTKMRRYFRLRTSFPIGDTRRYPVNLKLPFNVHINFGKTTGIPSTGLTINVPAAVAKSANKLKTKDIWKDFQIPFIRNFIPHNNLIVRGSFFDIGTIRHFGFPVLAKLIDGSRGRGLVYIRDEDALIEFLSDRSVDKTNYFYEKFFTATSEYRVHCSPHLRDRRYEFVINRGEETMRIVSENGCFLAVKKLMATEAHQNAMAEDGYVTRNMSDDVYFSTRFNKPRGWDNMIREAVMAIDVLGLDFGFIDVMYNTESGQYVFSESGSNPGMGRLQDDTDITNITALVYQKALVPIILNKANTFPQYTIQTPQTNTECAE